MRRNQIIIWCILLLLAVLLLLFAIGVSVGLFDVGMKMDALHYLTAILLIIAAAYKIIKLSRDK